MINDQTILSSFDDKPTLLEWLKKVEDALKTDTATAVSVENPSVNTYVFKIAFGDGTTLSSGNVVFPDSVKDVSIKNGHIIVTSVGGNVEDLGAINPYEDTIVLNSETNDVEINGETKINAGLEVLNEINCDNIVAKGAIQTDADLSVTGNAQVNGRLQVNSSIIANGEIRGGNISGTKFLLGTEEMPLVKANPTGDATETLTKLKVGGTTYGIGSDEIVESLDVNTTLTIPTAYFQLGVANDGKAIFMTNENAVDLVNGIKTLPISELLKYDEFSVKLKLNGNIMKAVFRKKYEVHSNGNAVTSNYNINLTFINGSLFNVEMELQFWKTSNTFNDNYSWCKVHIIGNL